MSKSVPKIMVSPLNWGLGHASRCVPIIHELIDQGAEVVIAAEEHPLALLVKEFPRLYSVELPGYNITYPSGGNMAVHMLKIMPRILKGIKEEQESMFQIVDDLKIDGIVSDNRFGLSHPKLKTVFVTHQVMIKSPFGESFIQKLNGRFINKYDFCWIPDYEGENNLSGDLSHKYAIPKHARFVGPLSRFTKAEKAVNPKYDVMGIVSGPEPQRTLFQHILQTELEILGINSVLVLGKSAENIRVENENLQIFSHLSASEMQETINASKIIVARSGYSTIMDLAALQMPAILIPTPGQTEQEYLAHYHFAKKHFYTVEQDRFDLEEALEYAQGFDGVKPLPTKNLLSNAVAEFLASL